MARPKQADRALMYDKKLVIRVTANEVNRLHKLMEAQGYKTITEALRYLIGFTPDM